MAQGCQGFPMKALMNMLYFFTTDVFDE